MSASTLTLGDDAPLFAAWVTAAMLAFGLPLLLAHNVPPSSTFLNQGVALVAWPAWLLLISGTSMPPVSLWPDDAATRAALSALALLALSALVAVGLQALPWSLALSADGLILAAGLTLLVGRAAVRGGFLPQAIFCCCTALVAVGTINVVIALIQVYQPDWADGSWIAATSLPGRAAGNLRQPNHLSSVMLWALVALAWLGDARRLPGWAVRFLMPAFVFVLVLTGSRTGTLGAILLGLWGCFDRQLSRSTRLLLVAMPLVYLVCSVGLVSLPGVGEEGAHVASRFSTQGDISASRFRIWSDTLELIRRHPWFGVGFGEFNFAWSLTPFPHRPVAFFDHTHNLPLQLAVELGLPLALLVLALLGFALWRAFRAAGEAIGPDRTALRAAFMMMLVMVLHSMLEYPLWYAYFLLPTAFALGLCLGGGGRRELPSLPDEATPPVVRRPAWGLQAAAALMLAGGLYSIYDYWKVVVIFAPGPGAASLTERIEEGKHSVFFAHHAHYAAATTATHPAEAMASFRSASHYLLDTRLMMAWAKAYDELGETDKARHLADRLREFHNAASQEFFDACEAPRAPGAAVPFQCVPASVPMDYHAFP